MQDLNRYTLQLALLLCISVSLSSVTEIYAQHASATQERLIDLEGGRNFRDLGGYETVDGRRVKWGKVFRSGVLHDLTAADYQKIDALEIETVIDLRDSNERRAEPTDWQAGDVKMMSWDYSMNLDDPEFFAPFMNPNATAQDMEQAMANMYVGIVADQKEHYKALFEQLISSEGPLLFHCTAGKDRTGVGAALVLTALGVDRHTVVADYRLTETYLNAGAMLAAQEASPEQQAQYAYLAALPPEAVGALMGARASYIESALDTMAQKSGSVESYIREELGVSDAELNTLRQHLLE